MNNTQLNWISQRLESWAEWRDNQNRVGWPKKSITGKLLDGMPGTYCPTCSGKGRMAGARIRAKAQFVICPTCSGNGRVKMALKPDMYLSIKECNICEGDGEIDKRTCFRCRGSGQIKRSNFKVNPASIPQTSYIETASPVCEQIDAILSEWNSHKQTRNRFRVVLYEYTRFGRKQDKARIIGVTARHYRRLLSEAHQLLYDVVKINA